MNKKQQRKEKNTKCKKKVKIELKNEILSKYYNEFKFISSIILFPLRFFPGLCNEKTMFVFLEDDN